MKFTALSIIEAVADASGVPTDYIIGGNCERKTTRARSLACWLMRSFCGMTYAAIGDAVRMTHAPAILSVRRVQACPEMRSDAMEVAYDSGLLYATESPYTRHGATRPVWTKRGPGHWTLTGGAA